MKPQPTVPQEAQPRPMHPSIAWAMAYIDEHLDERLSLDVLATEAGLSIWRFSTVFRQVTGVAPRRYICEQRVRRVQAMLAEGMPAADAASAAGFYDQSHLSRHFKKGCGMTPGQFLSQHRSAQALSLA